MSGACCLWSSCIPVLFMDKVNEAVGKANGSVSTKSDKTEDIKEGGEEDGKMEDLDDGEEESETQSLLQPQRKPEKSRRRVSWNDIKGNQLTEVLVYEPSDAGDSDDENADSCLCTIM